jgi:hypothetical protein
VPRVHPHFPPRYVRQLTSVPTPLLRYDRWWRYSRTTVHSSNIVRSSSESMSFFYHVPFSSDAPPDGLGRVTPGSCKCNTSPLGRKLIVSLDGTSNQFGLKVLILHIFLSYSYLRYRRTRMSSSSMIGLQNPILNLRTTTAGSAPMSVHQKGGHGIT